MRISDWSSDVCSSDLVRQRGDAERLALVDSEAPVAAAVAPHQLGDLDRPAGSELPAAAPGGEVEPAHRRAPPGDRPVAVGKMRAVEIGRASCRESVWQYVLLSVGAASLKTKTT